MIVQAKDNWDLTTQSGKIVKIRKDCFYEVKLSIGGYRVYLNKCRCDKVIIPVTSNNLFNQIFKEC